MTTLRTSPSVLHFAFAALLAPLAACSGEASAAPSAQAPLWSEGKTKLRDYDPERSLAPMIEAVSPAIVRIEAKGDARVAKLLPRFGPRRSAGVGSGFIIRADGLVVTNAHVVAGAEELELHLADGRVRTAELLGHDGPTDVALLRLKPVGEERFPVAGLGRSADTRVGDWVVAIGAPLGLDQTVTRGIVSAKGRGSLGLYADGYADFLQTDAAISPGNSGGPLLNLDGEVIGMNTAIAGMGLGLGFAVPVDQVKRVIEQLYASGAVQRGWLGLSADPQAEEGEARGARIGEVHPDTPAARAGLRAGDLILAIDGRPVDDFEDLRGRIGERKPGETLALEILRAGKKQSVRVELAQRPSPQALSRMGAAPSPRPEPERSPSP